MTPDPDQSRSLVRKSFSAVSVAAAATVLQHTLSLATQIALARLLVPEDFGLVALAMVAANLFAAVSYVHGDKLLVRAEKVDVPLFGSVVTTELSLATVMMTIAVVAAGPIAIVLGEPGLQGAVALLSVLCFQHALTRPRTLFERDLDFVRARWPSVVAQAAGGGLAIASAIAGLGYWSIVVWRIAPFILEAALLWSISPLPLRFSTDRSTRRSLFRLGLPLMASGLLIYFYWNVDYYIVGRMMGREQLGYYWLAFQTTHYLLQFRSTISSVVYPFFARLSDRATMAGAFDALTAMTAIALLLPAVLLLALGDALVAVIFGPEWEPATPLLQIFAIVVALRGATSYWEPVFVLLGRSRAVLRLTMVNALIIGVLGPALTFYFGARGMATAVLVSVGIMILTGAPTIRELLKTSVISLVGAPLMVALLVTLALMSAFRDLSAARPGQLALAAVAVSAIYLSVVYVVFRDRVANLTRLLRQDAR